MHLRREKFPETGFENVEQPSQASGRRIKFKALSNSSEGKSTTLPSSKSGRDDWLTCGRVSTTPEIRRITAVNALMEIETYKGPQKWKQAVMKSLTERPTAPAYGDTLNAHQISSVIHDVMADHDPLYVIDGGETGQWAQSVLPSDLALTNGLSGAIGGSIPQAIGAAMARPEKHVVAIMGDGSAGFLIGEIETARRLGLKITVVICNDLRWGAEVEIQKRVYGEDRVHSCDLDNKTRYDKVAQAFGANGVMVETEDALRAALEKSVKSRKPTVINAMMEGLPAPSF